MIIEENVATYGSIGNSLVKGVVMELAANAISIKSGGKIESLTVNGDIITHGDGVTSYALEGGEVKELNIGGKIIANGKNAKELVKNEDLA
ncbi:hypothetical protein V7112_17730 [Bacillus sp. JJ1566]|uniref:hypothetical protein n=1 Tax=Bacillus sp. JJ1566 TaxID=3122961 RepID=UPI0030004A44